MPLHPDLPPDVVAREAYGGCWPPDRKFPLTPNECLAIMMGYEVRPSRPISDEDYDLLPGKIEMSRFGGLVLWRS